MSLNAPSQFGSWVNSKVVTSSLSGAGYLLKVGYFSFGSPVSAGWGKVIIIYWSYIEIYCISVSITEINIIAPYFNVINIIAPCCITIHQWISFIFVLRSSV